MKHPSQAWLKEIGLGPLWRLRKAWPNAPFEPISGLQAGRVQETVGGPNALALPPLGPEALQGAGQDSVDQLDWPALGERVAGCRACALCEQRQQAVLGVGDLKARWLFVGEGPDAEEDSRGEPFVGAAGKLLDAMFSAIDLKRGEEVYITNAVKCRPPGNRTPSAEEIAACKPYLLRQIALIKPRLIVALGRPAAQALLGREVRIAESRGTLFYTDGIPVVVTYHPAYLLRNLPDKARAWEDLLFARATFSSLSSSPADPLAG